MHGRFAIQGSVDSFSPWASRISNRLFRTCPRRSWPVSAKWFEEFAAEQWDRQIEADIAAGRLNAVGKRADEDFEAGRCTPL